MSVLTAALEVWFECVGVGSSLATASRPAVTINGEPTPSDHQRCRAGRPVFGLALRLSSTCECRSMLSSRRGARDRSEDEYQTDGRSNGLRGFESSVFYLGFAVAQHKTTLVNRGVTRLAAVFLLQHHRVAGRKLQLCASKTRWQAVQWREHIHAAIKQTTR